MSIEGRRRVVRQHGYCENCLARSHITDDCISADVCQICGWAHHTLLHIDHRRNLQSTSNRHQTTRRPRGSTQQPPNSNPRRSSAPRRSSVPQQQRVQRHQEPRTSQERPSRGARRVHPYSRPPTSNRRASNDAANSTRFILRKALRVLTVLEKSLS